MKLLKAIQNLYLTTQPKPWKLQKPVVIQFPVNDICNSRCQMCNIWEQKFDYQISPNELVQALANPLFSEVRAVGVNGGEPTLRNDLADLIDVLFQKLPQLSNISLITNSFNSSQVIQRIIEIGKVIESHGGKLNVMVSLDGVGEIHDKVRGRKGNFENAIKVIDFIKESNLVSSKRLGCTVIKDNIYGVDDLLAFALEKEIYIKYRLGIPHQRLYSKQVIDPFDLSFKEKYHLAIFLENLIKFYEESEQQNFFYESLIGQLIYQKPRLAGCDWQNRGVTLSARGELLYCAVESKVLGSAVSGNAEKVYFENSQHLAEIIKDKCDSCVHDYVGLPPSKILLKSYTKRAFSNIGIPLSELKRNKVLKPLRSFYQKLRFKKRLKFHDLNFKKHGELQVAKCFPKHSTNKRKVLICGWYGTETLGDKAILGGIVTSLKNYLGDFDLHLVSLEPYISEMTIQQMSELEECKLHSMKDGITITDSMDLVVFGGGPLMAISEVAEMIAIFHRAVDSKVPTLIAGCGVGPLGKSYHNQSIKYLLSLASHRIYRDAKSQKLAQTLGIDISQDKIAEDPAFTWLANFKNSEVAVNSPEEQTLLLCLRDWPYEQYAHELSPLAAEALKTQFEESVISALENLLDRYPRLRIVPFPMCTNHIGGDDRWFYRRILGSNTKITNASNLTYLGAEVRPSEAINIFKTASAALTMRFHSLVFALSIGLPTVSIDYTLGKGKVKSLAEKYQVLHTSLDSITVEFIVNSISEILDQKNKEFIPSISSKNLLFERALHEFMDSLNND